MPSSTTSTSNCFNPLLLLTLLSTFMITRQSTIGIANTAPKVTYIYDQDGGKYNKITDGNQKIDFENGEWYFSEKLRILEFHSNVAGFLDFSSSARSFYKALFLDNKKRVLVFPQEGEGESRRPYVAKTRLSEFDSFERDPIFPDADMSLEEVFNQEDVLKKVFPEDQRAALVKDWNYLPYVNPQLSGKGTFNSFNNHWGRFINFSQKVFKVMETTPKKNEVDREAKKQMKIFWADSVIRRLVQFIFGKDHKMMTVPAPGHKKFSEAVNLNKMAERLTRHALKIDNIADRIDEFENAFYDVMWPLCKKIMLRYLRKNINSYLVSFLGDAYDQPTLDKYYQRWSYERLKFPYKEWSLKFNRKVTASINLKLAEADDEENETVRSNLLKLRDLRDESKQSFTTLIKDFFGIVFDAIDAMDDEARETFELDVSVFNEDAAPVLHEIYEDSDAAKKKYFEMFEKVNMGSVFKNFVFYEGINATMFRLEERVFNDYLRKWPAWDELDMKMYPKEGDKEYALFQPLITLLKLVGEWPLGRGRDEGVFKTEKVSIFKLNNRRIII